MSNKILFLLLFLSVAGLCHAQKKECKTYYDSLDNKVSNPADAYYYHLADTTKLTVRVTYYYTDGNLYAKGRGVWKESTGNAYIERTDKWKYYYPEGNKQQILYNKKRIRFWYENGIVAYKSTKVYNFRFKSWYWKNTSWYANGQLKSSGFVSLDYACKYGYYRFYNRMGKRWLEEYFAQSLQGVSVYTDEHWRIKYYIVLDGSSFEDASFDPATLKNTTHEPSFLEAKEGYNELIYELDTFRFTVKNGYMEGAYYHRQGEHRTYIGSYHRNYKTAHWQSISKGTRGNYIYHYNDYKNGCLHGNSMLLLNDSMLLMKGRYRYDKKKGKWLIADGTMSDPHVMGDKDSLYFREEKFRHDIECSYYQNIYAANKTDFSIKYLFQKTRNNFFTKSSITTQFYPNHRVKKRIVYNEKKKIRTQKTYDESGNLIERSRLPE